MDRSPSSPPASRTSPEPSFFKPTDSKQTTDNSSHSAFTRVSSQPTQSTTSEVMQMLPFSLHLAERSGASASADALHQKCPSQVPQVRHSLGRGNSQNTPIRRGGRKHRAVRSVEPQLSVSNDETQPTRLKKRPKQSHLTQRLQSEMLQSQLENPQAIIASMPAKLRAEMNPLHPLHPLYPLVHMPYIQMPEAQMSRALMPQAQMPQAQMLLSRMAHPMRLPPAPYAQMPHIQLGQVQALDLVKSDMKQQHGLPATGQPSASRSATGQSAIDHSAMGQSVWPGFGADMGSQLPSVSKPLYGVNQHVNGENHPTWYPSLQDMTGSFGASQTRPSESKPETSTSALFMSTSSPVDDPSESKIPGYQLPGELNIPSYPHSGPLGLTSRVSRMACLAPSDDSSNTRRILDQQAPCHPCQCEGEAPDLLLTTSKIGNIYVCLQCLKYFCPYDMRRTHFKPVDKPHHLYQHITSMHPGSPGALELQKLEVEQGSKTKDK